jgi:hypothetical protein
MLNSTSGDASADLKAKEAFSTSNVLDYKAKVHTSGVKHVLFAVISLGIWRYFFGGNGTRVFGSPLVVAFFGV